MPRPGQWPGRWIARIFQKYWRVVRGVRLSVEACVIDESGRILMVRNESGGTWELPRGLVLKNENLEMALRRMLSGLAAVEVNSKFQLSFFYVRGKSEQTGVYVIPHSRHVDGPEVNKVRFFAPLALPDGADPQAAGRIRRCLEQRTASEV